MDQIEKDIMAQWVRNRASTEVSPRSRKALENGIEVPGLPQGSTASKFGFNGKYLSTAGMDDSAKLAIRDILKGKGTNPDQVVSHNISGGIKNFDSYRNPAQHTVEAIEQLNRNLGNSEFVEAIVADTEWIGGDAAGKASPIEVGFQKVKIGENGVEKIGDPVSYAIKIGKEDKKRYQAMIDRLRSAKGTPSLNEDEYRSLKDLANIANDKSINPDTRMKHKIMDGEDLTKYVDDIQAGLDHLSGDTNRAIEAVELGDRISKDIMGGGFTLNKDTAFIWHNGYNADLKVWADTLEPGNNPFLKANNIDTNMILRNVIDEPVQAIYNGKSTVAGALKLESLHKEWFPDVSLNRHRAGDDASAGADIFARMWNKGYVQDTTSLRKDNSIWGRGTKLFSTGSIRRESPLDIVTEIGSNEPLNKVRDYQGYATYRDVMYEISDEFVTNYKDQDYYGVVLKNLDDPELEHIVTARTKRDLQSKIQSNFMDMDLVTRRHGAKAADNYVMKRKATRAYRNMFSGYKAYDEFDNFMQAADWISSQNRTKELHAGRLSKTLTKDLVKEGKLTKSQADKFALLYPRLRSEYEVLDSFRKTIESGVRMTTQEKSASLVSFKALMDQSLGSHLEDLRLPDYRKQGKLYNGLGDLFTVNLKDRSSLSMSIYSELTRNSKHSSSFSFQDIKNNARKMLVSWSKDPDLMAGNILEELPDEVSTKLMGMRGYSGLLSKDEIKGALDRISRIKPSAQGSTSGATYISNILAGVLEGKEDLFRQTFIPGQESLKARKTRKAIPDSDIKGVVNWTLDRMRSGERFHVNDPRLEKQFNEINENILNRVKMFSSEAGRNKTILPRTIQEELEEVGKRFKQAHIDFQVEYKKGDSRGLKMKFYSDKVSQGVAGYQGKSMEVFIPLVNPETGLLEGNNKYVNQLVPTMDYVRGSGDNAIYMPRLQTSQNRMFEVLRQDGNFNAIVDAFNGDGNTGYIDAQSKITKAINRVSQGIPTGATYTQEIADQLNGSSVYANFTRTTVDLNQMAYHVLGKDGYKNLNNPGEFLAMIMYNKDELIKNRYPNMDGTQKALLSRADELRRNVNSLGLNLNFSGVKGEAAQHLRVSATTGDPRLLSPFGMYSDPARENLRQVWNLYELNQDDIVTTRRGIRTRRGILDRYDDRVKNRIYSNPVVTDKFREIAGKRQDTVTLRTALMTDYDIMENMSDDIDNVDIVNRLTTHDDMMVVREDMIDHFTTRRNRIIELDAHEEIADNISEGMMLRDGDRISSVNGGTTYSSKYEAIVKGSQWDEKKGKHILSVEEIIPGKHGTKIMDVYGNKYTSVVSVSADEIAALGRGKSAIEQQLFQAFSEVEAIAKPSTSKAPGSVVGGRLALLAEEINEINRITKTVGDVETKKVQEEVSSILQNIMGVKVKYVTNEATGGIQLVPEVLDEGLFSLGNSAKATGEAFEYLKGINLKGYSPKNHKIAGKAGDISMVNMSYVVSQVEDWTRATGSEEGLVKIGLRHLEFLKHREGKFSANIGVIRDKFERQINTQGGKYADDYYNLLAGLSDAYGKSLVEEKDMGIIRTTGADRSNFHATKNFDDIYEIGSYEGGKYLKKDLEGSIVDDLFDGRNFYLELPEEVKVGDKKINRVMMSATHFAEAPGDEVYLNEVQKAQKRVFDSVSNYRQTVKQGADAPAGALVEARKRMQRSVDGYYKDVGGATFYSKGYIGRNYATSKQKHSGFFNYRGQNPLVMNDPAIKNKLAEGEALVSRADLRKMIGDEMSDDAIAELMAKAEKEGISAISMREPVKEFSSMSPVKLKIMSEEAERAATGRLGKDALSGNAWMTLGTQIRQGADHDGDRFALILPQISGAKVDAVQNQAMDAWHAEETARTSEFTDYLLKNDYDVEKMAKEYADSLTDDSLLIKRSGASGVDKIAMVESRLKKQVGKFSNMNTRYRRLAETVGSVTTDNVRTNRAFDLMNYVGGSIEQAPISAKHMTETISDLMDNGIESFSDYTMASERLYQSLSNFDKEGIMSEMKNLGIMRQEEAGGRWYFHGVKTEGVRAALDLKGDANALIYEDEVMDMFNSIQGVTPDGNVAGFLNSGAMDMMLSAPNSGQAALNRAGDITNPTKITVGNFYVKEFMLEGSEGGKRILTQHMNKAERMSQVEKLRKGIIGDAADETYNIVRGLEETSTYTAADSVKEAAEGVTSRIFNSQAGRGIGKIAGVAGAAWLASTFIGSPTSRNVQEAHEDQAPSSDGTYIDPSIYAGAPPGTAPPTARISPKGGGYEKTTVKINAQAMNGMSNEEVANIVSGEIQRQTGANMNINIVSQDDRTKIDRDWLDQQFANALEKGYSY